MAGTLTISTLSDGTNSTSSTNCIQGSAKAWVSFNGVPATPTIRASYNVGSITKNGTGDYTVNFTAALVDANYSVTGSGTNAGATNSQLFLVADNSTTRTSSVVRMIWFGLSGATADCQYANVSIFR